MVHSFSG